MHILGHQIDLYRNDLMYKRTTRLADSPRHQILFETWFSTTRPAGFAHLKESQMQIVHKGLVQDDMVVDAKQMTPCQAKA